ncbi:hypothetical protein Tco_0540688 [Tanacetum coccineum]
MITTFKLKISDEFLKILQDNTFNGMDGGDVVDHIAKVLEITEWIKMPNVENNELRLRVFLKSLSGDAKIWWNNEINETTITWGELNDNFFHKYYPLSHTCKNKIPDDLDDGTDYFEFICWLASKFDNYWEIDKNTKNGLWEFYEAKDIYEVINSEYSLIPILARRDINNLDELCRTEEFTVIRHSIGNNEEFVTVGASKIDTIERTPGSMSCIYHELFNRKDRGWEDLAKTMICEEHQNEKTPSPPSRKKSLSPPHALSKSTSSRSTHYTSSSSLTNDSSTTLAQTLIEIKAAKPKARGVIVQEPSEFTTTTSPSQPSQLPQAKDKGKAKMVEPEKPLKKKDQIMFDKEVAQKLQAQLDAELEEEEKLARQREEDANIAEWDNVQAMMDADYELAARLQAEEQGELTIEEKSRLFVELMNKRKKHFARLRAEEQRRKPPTKAQKRNTMSTYLKNMAGYKHNQLKTKSFEDIQMLFDKEMKRVNTFVDMDTELVKGSETRTEGSSKRAGEELESKNLKKQKLDENVEAKVDDDQEEAEMKKHMEIVPDDEVAIDAIPLATKPLIIMLQNIDIEDLETLWKLVKAKHGLTRPEESYERVL